MCITNTRDGVKRSNLVKQTAVDAGEHSGTVQRCTYHVAFRQIPGHRLVFRHQYVLVKNFATVPRVAYANNSKTVLFANRQQFGILHFRSVILLGTVGSAVA